MKRKKVIVLIFTFVTVGFLCAAKFTFSADSVMSQTAKGKEKTVLKGNAKIVSDSTDIRADLIELTGTDFRYAQCTGNISVLDPQRGISIVSSTLFFDRVENISRILGQCTMEDKKNKVVIKGGYLENNDKTEITIIQIGVRILKENMVCRSEYAFYKRAEKILELTGNPVVFFEGNEYKATRIIINVETDEILLEGSVQGVIVKKEEKKAESVESTQNVNGITEKNPISPEKKEESK